MKRSKKILIEKYVNLRCKQIQEQLETITEKKKKLPKYKDIEPQPYHLKGRGRKKRMTNLYLDKIKQEFEFAGTPEKWDNFLNLYQASGSPKIVDPEYARGLQKIFSKRGFYNPLTKTIHGVESMSSFDKDMEATKDFLAKKYPNLSMDDIDVGSFLDVEPHETVTDELTHALQFQKGGKRGRKIATFLTKDLPLHINQSVLGGKKGPYDTEGSLEHHAHTDVGQFAKNYLDTGNPEDLKKAIDISKDVKLSASDHDHSGHA